MGRTARARRPHRAHRARRRLLLARPRRRVPRRATGDLPAVPRSTRPTPRSTGCSAPTAFTDWPEPALHRSRRGDVHERHHRPTQGRRDHAGQLRLRRQGRWPRRRRCTADDRQLVVLPLFHANAQYYSFASAIWAGASVALDAHVLGQRLPRPGRPARRHVRQPVRRPDADDPRPRRPPVDGVGAAALLVRAEHHRRPVRDAQRRGSAAARASCTG